MIYEECPHGRHKGAYCEPCAEEIIWNPDTATTSVDPVDLSSKPVEKKQESGLDAPYYDFPPDCKSAMDLVEWLEKGGMSIAEFNILKSIIRSNNPNAKKKTTPIYEAEKQFYYAERRLRSLQKESSSGD